MLTGQSRSGGVEAARLGPRIRSPAAPAAARNARLATAALDKTIERLTGGARGQSKVPGPLTQAYLGRFGRQKPHQPDAASGDSAGRGAARQQRSPAAGGSARSSRAGGRLTATAALDTGVADPRSPMSGSAGRRGGSELRLVLSQSGESE